MKKEIVLIQGNTNYISNFQDLVKFRSIYIYFFSKKNVPQLQHTLTSR